MIDEKANELYLMDRELRDTMNLLDLTLSQARYNLSKRVSNTKRQVTDQDILTAVRIKNQVEGTILAIQNIFEKEQ